MATRSNPTRAQRIEVTEKHPTGEGFADKRTAEQWARDIYCGLR